MDDRIPTPEEKARTQDAARRWMKWTSLGGLALIGIGLLGFVLGLPAGAGAGFVTAGIVAVGLTSASAMLHAVNDDEPGRVDLRRAAPGFGIGEEAAKHPDRVGWDGGTGHWGGAH